jgi:signal peptidase
VALLVLTVAYGVVAVAVFSGAYQVRPVLSGSMRPHLQVGSVVITKSVPVTSVRKGDVIVFHEPDDADKLVVHRVVELDRSAGQTIISTKGDANSAPDPWRLILRGNTSYRVVGDIPWLGQVAVWAHQPGVRGATLPAGLALAALSVLLLAWPRKGGRPGRQGHEGGDAPAEVSARLPETADQEAMDATEEWAVSLFGTSASDESRPVPLTVPPSR